MGRTRTFDSDQIVKRSMECFWQNGYSNTSIRDLEDATGLRVSSIYNAFGDKAGLFEVALKHYVERYIESRISNLVEIDDPIMAIRNDFDSTMRNITPNQNFGCFLISTLAEAHSHPHLLREYVLAQLQRVDDALTAAVRRAQKLGQVSSSVSPKHLCLRIQSMVTMLALRHGHETDGAWREKAFLEMDSLLGD